MILEYTLNTVIDLMKSKEPLYSIYKYCVPIIYNLLNFESLINIFTDADIKSNNSTAAKYTKILLDEKISDSHNYYREFLKSKYNYDVKLRENFDKENKGLYNKFFEDLNKISIISNEIFEDVELIKKLWLQSDHKICLLENIIYYYSYIFYEYYGNYADREIINQNIGNVIFENKTKLIGNIDSKKVLSIENCEENNPEYNQFSSQLKNLFFEPFSFGVAELFFKPEKNYCVLLDRIKIINMVLNDNYNREMMPWNSYEIKNIYRKERNFFAPYIDLKTENTQLFHRYYFETKIKIKPENIISRLENYYFTDIVSNSSNIYGSCIDTIYNPINNFEALMKSNSYQNIKSIYPFFKYGFIPNREFGITNQIIQYCKTSDDINCIGNLPNETDPEPKSNPNCLEQNLIEKQKTNLVFRDILLNYIEKMKTIEKQDTQPIFYNLFSIIKLYFSTDQDPRLNITNLLKKFNFPSNLYSVDELDLIEKNCYFKVIAIFNNLIYLFYKENISTDEKKTFAQFYKFFISIIESIKSLNESSEYDSYYDEPKTNLIDTKENELNNNGILKTFSNKLDKYDKDNDNVVITNIDNRKFETLVKDYRCKVDGTEKKKEYRDIVTLGHLSDKPEIKKIIIKLNFYDCKIDNNEFNIRFNFFDIIKAQLTNIIAERYELVGLIFKDLLINDNLYIRFNNEESYYITKGYRFYKNIHGKKIKDHVLVLKEDYSHYSDYQNRKTPDLVKIEKIRRIKI